MSHANFGQADGAILLVDVVVLGLELLDDLRHAAVPLQVALGRSGDDERRAGFVDQDVVDLVHDGVVVAALHAIGEAHGHVVAQVVKAKFGVGAVGDIGGVGLDAIDHAEMQLVLVGRFLREIHKEGLLAVLGDGCHLQDADGQAQASGRWAPSSGRRGEPGSR